MKKENKEKKSMLEEECECGFPVRGVNKEQLNQNMKVHKEGKKHRELMEIKNRRLQRKLK